MPSTLLSRFTEVILFIPQICDMATSIFDIYGFICVMVTAVFLLVQFVVQLDLENYSVKQALESPKIVLLVISVFAVKKV